MKGFAKTAALSVAVLVALFAVFVAVVIVESNIRERKKRPIPIAVQGSVKPVKAEAYAMPDFLWAGEAWWIRIECAHPLEVDLDGIWVAKVPAGKVHLYRNHDHENLSSYNATPFTNQTPSLVTLRK